MSSIPWAELATGVFGVAIALINRSSTSKAKDAMSTANALAVQLKDTTTQMHEHYKSQSKQLNKALDLIGDVIHQSGGGSAK